MDYKISNNDKTPLYKQIVRKLSEAIDNGEFLQGKKLPTERELSVKFNVARGTIKNVFNELEREGKIRKVQGSGTFLIMNSGNYENSDIADLIRELVDRLVSLNLSQEQIERIIIKEIWIRLKDEEKVSLGWIDCSVELLHVIAKQISQKCNINVKTFLVGDIIKNPSLIKEKFDLIATTVNHYNEITKVVSNDILPMKRVILSVSNKTVGKIAKIRKEDNVAILYKSVNFLELVNDNLKRINNIKNKKEFSIIDEQYKLMNEIYKFNTVIIPPNCRKDEGMFDLMDKCKYKEIIEFEYMLDKGSLIHLEKEVQKFWINKHKFRKI